MTFQMTVKSGDLFNQGHEAPPGKTHPRPTLYGHAYCDQAGGRGSEQQESELARIYGDLGTENAYALIGLRIGPMLWQMLTGDLGARKVQDIDACKDVAVRLRALEADIAAMPARADELRSRSNSLVSRPSRVRRPEEVIPGSATEHVKLDLALKLLGAVYDQNAELYALIQDLHTVTADQHALLFEALAASETRKELVVNLQDLLKNSDRFRRVPDDEPLTIAERRRIEADELYESLKTMPALPGAAQVRPWLTQREFGSLLRVTPATTSRWTRGLHLPSRPVDRPWEAHAIPVERLIEYPPGPDGKRRSNAKWRRIWFPGIKAAFWHARGEKVQETAIELMSEYPKAQGWADRDRKPTLRSLAPLDLSEPFASEYAAARSGEDAEVVTGEVVDAGD